jgi:hypothetical protein
MNDSIVYVRPLYLQSEQTAMPQLTRVVVACGDKVAMEPDLAAALLSVFGEAERGDEGQGVADAATAWSLYEKAVEAQQAGDWGAYGRYLEQLGDVLLELSGEASATIEP